MPSYNLEGLGSDEFEKLVQALLKEVIGSGTITFGAGKDGAREATFEGRAPYPSESEQWQGRWIFQAKFHNTALLGVDKSRKQVIQDLQAELQKITEKYKYKCDNYVMITNVPLTAVADVGNHDTIEKDIKQQYRSKISNIHVWGADDVNKLLEKYAAIRTAYLHFIVPGDLLAQLLNSQAEKTDDTAITIRDYIQTLFNREQNAQLDQAGDVSEEPVRIQQVFFDLNAALAPFDYSTKQTLGMTLQINRMIESLEEQGRGLDSVSPLHSLITEALDRVVIVGGPGEGKSTIGQYLAQLHRGSILKRIDEIAIDDRFIPVLPRIPFRVALRDFAQWLARQSDDAPNNVHSLDEYLAFQIQQASKRQITTNDLHNIIRKNPILLILDGLDEVSGQKIRKDLLDRVTEFTDRCESLLEADMQILASTRPTGYSNQFDPHRYIHLRLVNLDAQQVRHYVQRWIAAKDLESSKSERLTSSIEECLNDPQISLLTNTPLQITILVLIISGGGTPPRQREALFNEYLDVIFKRETAKGKHIISSEKEKLVGLHKYVGYLLHERTTRAQAAGSELNRAEYEETVSGYLKFCDPYSKSQARQAELLGITREAGERLVLIVEKQSDVFGFELRSIQEFFAACHLSDTSIDTVQRYKRFDAIAKLDHWRNVALFFAGRVGRNYYGESANIVETCRALNRDFPGIYTKKGSVLALELAADRAFNHNRRLQRNLLEIGLELVSKSLTAKRRESVIDLLQRLPDEDLHDLLFPIIQQRNDLLSAEHLTHMPYILSDLNAPSNMILEVVRKLKNDPRCHREALRAIFTLGLSQNDLPGIILELVNLLTPAQTASCISVASWKAFVQGISGMLLDGVEPSAVSGVLAIALKRVRVPGRGTSSNLAAASEHSKQTWPNSLPGIALSAASLMHAFTWADESRRSGRNFEEWKSAVLSTSLMRVPKSILDGSWFDANLVDSSVPESCLGSFLWAVHLTFGEVTQTTARAFLSYFSTHTSHKCLVHQATLYSKNSVPFSDLAAAITPNGDLEDLVNILVKFAGSRGRQRWDDFCQAIDGNLEVMSPDERESIAITGLAAMSADTLNKIMPGISEMEVDIADYHLIAAHTLRYRRDRRGVANARSSMDLVRAGRLLHNPRRSVLREACTGLTADENVDTSLAEEYVEVLLGLPPEIQNVQTIVQIFFRHFAGPSTLDDLADRVLCYIGEHSRIWSHAFVGTDEQQVDTVVKGLFPVVVSDRPGNRRDGATYLLLQACLSVRTLSRHRNTRLHVRFAGFNALHRNLAKTATSPAEEALAIALFYVRPPSGVADWNLLQSMLLNADVAQVARFADFISSIAPLDVKNLESWINLISSLLESNSREQAIASLTDTLSVLISERNQSLSGDEQELGLPLQETT